MTMHHQTTSFWARVWNWIIRFEDGLNYDGTQYVVERMQILQVQVDTLTQRVEQLEKGPELSPRK